MRLVESVRYRFGDGAGFDVDQQQIGSVTHPLEAGRRGRGAMRVIRDAAPVVDGEPAIVQDGLVVGDDGVVGVRERLGVDEAEVGDIEKPFELAAGVATSARGPMV